MKRKIFSLLGIVALLISAVSILTNVQAEGMPPYDTYTAPYVDTITVDGYINDWGNETISYIYLFLIDDDSQYTDLMYAFAYNSTHLFGFVQVAPYLGNVTGLDINFFGKPDQNDAVHIETIYNMAVDLAFPDPTMPPVPDEDVGGTNDVVAAVYNETTGWMNIEFVKPLASGDINGQDINLAEGNSIAVEFVAWIGIDPAYGPPNAAISPSYDFRYIRLNIGYDGGDYLDIPLKAMGPPGWAYAYDLQAHYYSPALTYDGEFNEPDWQNAIENFVDFYYFEWDTGYWEPNNVITASIRILYDDLNLYVGIDLYVPYTVYNNLTFYVMLSDHDWFYDDETGFDLLMFDYFSGMAEDLWMDPSHGEPMPDVEIGGQYNIQSYGMQYIGNGFRVEFSRPLNDFDWDYDAQLNINETMYMSFAASLDSAHGPPNYVAITPVYDPEIHTDQPMLSVYGVPLGGGYPEPEGLPEIIEGSSMNAIFSNDSIAIDGSDSEPIWDQAEVISGTLTNMWVESTHTTMQEMGDVNFVLKAVNDGTNIYIFMKIGVELQTENDSVMLLFSEIPQFFNDSDGVDMFMVNTFGNYEDFYFSDIANDEPVPDIDLGGTRDGRAAVSVIAGETLIEIERPMNNPDGYDFYGQAVDRPIYVTLLMSYQSDGAPNYFEVQFDTNNMPQIITHGIQILTEGSGNTTGTETGTNENTLVIGFSTVDFLLITATFVGTISAIRMYRKKKH